jgi:hypothetical protein
VASIYAGWGTYAILHGLMSGPSFSKQKAAAQYNQTRNGPDQDRLLAVQPGRWLGIALGLILTPIAAGSAFCCTCYPLGVFLFRSETYFWPVIVPAFIIGGIAGIVAGIGAWTASRTISSDGSNSESAAAPNRST